MSNQNFTARYFGSAGAAAVNQETRTETTVAEFKRAAGSHHGPELVKILEVASILVNGQATQNDDLVIPIGATIDVLPPFAGG